MTLVTSEEEIGVNMDNYRWTREMILCNSKLMTQLTWLYQLMPDVTADKINILTVAQLRIHVQYLPGALLWYVRTTHPFVDVFGNPYVSWILKR